jgi:hypothetical protein
VSGVIRWEDPPPPRTSERTYARAVDWYAIADELRGRPGEWAVAAVRRGSSSAASLAWQINHANLAAFKGDRFEAVARVVGDEARIYARYVGEPS